MPENSSGQLYILSGPVDSGKTSALSALAQSACRSGLRMAGVLSHKRFQDESFIGYDAELLATGKRLPLARLHSQAGTFPGRRFHFFQAAFDGLTAELNEPASDIFIIDEIGPLELEGHGFARYLPDVIQIPAPVLIVIRTHCLDDCIRSFKLQSATLITDLDKLSLLFRQEPDRLL